ncbi:hypothetical protein BU16DRAFT_616376 [Lophium mytilinum]|uniref:Uncharacterized protein n=1 Tax=Lophium mytilinum TaxID=390894 RepID=A0A6A6QZ84_9PEZI|nr:hypothetical protein BU16DRAFT_616376 [Lophium mytilinum]
MTPNQMSRSFGIYRYPEYNPERYPDHRDRRIPTLELPGSPGIKRVRQIHWFIQKGDVLSNTWICGPFECTATFSIEDIQSGDPLECREDIYCSDMYMNNPYYPDLRPASETIKFRSISRSIQPDCLRYVSAEGDNKAHYLAEYGLGILFDTKSNTLETRTFRY